MSETSGSRGLRNTAVGLLGLCLTAAFFMGWFAGHSGFDVARDGGWGLFLYAIPLAGLWAGYEGLGRRQSARLAALGAAATLVVALLVVTLWHADYKAQIAIVGGVVLLVGGSQGKWLELALPAGLVLAALSAYFAIRYGIGPDSCESAIYCPTPGLRFKILGALTSGLAYLSYLIPVAAAWLLVAGISGKARAAAMVFAGASIVGVFTYASLVTAFGLTALAGDTGLWITSGAALGLFVLALLPARKSAPTGS